MNRDQNAIFNALMSRSNSHLTGSQGADVAIFTAENSFKLEDALKALGFKHDIRSDKRGQIFGETVWWHAGVELLVCNVPGSKTWTIGTAEGSIKSAEMSPVTDGPTLRAKVEIWELEPGTHIARKLVKMLARVEFEIPEEECKEARPDWGEYLPLKTLPALERALRRRGAFSAYLPSNQTFLFGFVQDAQRLKVTPTAA